MQGVLLRCCQGTLPGLCCQGSVVTVLYHDPGKRLPGERRRRGTIRISERAASRPEPNTMTIAPQTMTLDEFLAKYEDDAVLEYAQGVVTEKMAPSLPHSALASLIGQQIN